MRLGGALSAESTATLARLGALLLSEQGATPVDLSQYAR